MLQPPKSVVLSLLRRHTFGHDLAVPGVNAIHTSFLSLKQMVDLKRNLHSMVTSQEWLDSLYSKEAGGLAMQDLIINDAFWNSCILIVNLMDPLLRLLRIVSSEKRPAMGYVYAGMYRRFFLNPKFFFSVEGDILSEIQSGLIDCIERLVPESIVQDKIMKELNAYKNAAGDFGRKMAIRARDTLLPAEWWSTYGGGCPNLARLAIRILSQTCSSSGCKRDQIPFEEILNTVNNMEHQRLSDLVFVQYNLRLGQIGKCEDAPADPTLLHHQSKGLEALSCVNHLVIYYCAGFDDIEILERVKDVEGNLFNG